MPRNNEVVKKNNVLSPRIYYPNFIVLSSMLRDVQNIILNLKKKAIYTLDIGCGKKPYFPLLSQFSDIYVGVDIDKKSFADCIGQAENLPFQDEVFDLIISTQVLEHVQDPFECCKEMHRVLKKGGIVFATSPGIYPYHGPSDYRRYTHEGLLRIFSLFGEVRVLPHCGPVGSLARVLNEYIKVIKVPRLIKNFLIATINLGGLTFNKATRKYKDFHNKFLIANYTVIARK